MIRSGSKAEPAYLANSNDKLLKSTTDLSVLSVLNNWRIISKHDDTHMLFEKKATMDDGPVVLV